MMMQCYQSPSTHLEITAGPVLWCVSQNTRLQLHYTDKHHDASLSLMLFLVSSSCQDSRGSGQVTLCDCSKQAQEAFINSTLFTTYHAFIV